MLRCCHKAKFHKLLLFAPAGSYITLRLKWSQIAWKYNEAQASNWSHLCKIHTSALVRRRKLFHKNSWQKSVFKYPLLLNKMQSDFPFGHFCVENNRLTMENAQAYLKHIVFSQRGRVMCAGLRSWIKSPKCTRLNRCSEHREPKVSLLENLEIEITSWQNALVHNVCKFRLWRFTKGVRQLTNHHEAYCVCSVILHDLYLTMLYVVRGRSGKYGGHFQT